MKALVTGGAGFVGTNLVRLLLSENKEVVVADNLCRGLEKNLIEFEGNARFRLVVIHLDRPELVTKLFQEETLRAPIDEVWHLAANSDIQAGITDPGVDHRDTFLTTYNVVNAMRSVGCKRLYFSSTSAIYGDLGNQELREDIGPLLPISNYGAMKLASEAFISAAVESHLERALIFRFPNVVGVPATHGVLLDFSRKLKTDRSQLEVLGNGTQQKGYLHVSDLIAAMVHLRDTVTEKIDVFNIGSVDEGVTVRQIAEDFVALVAPEATIRFGISPRGWVGDVPRFHYSVGKLLGSGWRPLMNSREAMKRAMEEVAKQEGLV